MTKLKTSIPLGRPCPGYGSFILLLLACLCTGSARAQTLVTNVIYEDHFSGSGQLNGWMPDTVDVGTNAWIAGVPWTTDGTEATELSGLSCGFLPFVPAPGRVYQLSAALEDETGAASWTAMGFTETATAASGTYFASAVNAVGWLLVGPVGSQNNWDQCFIGPNTLSGVAEPGFGGQNAFGPTNYTIVLDTRPSNPTNWTFTFLNGSTVMRPTEIFGTPSGEKSGPVINYIGIGNGNPGDFSIVQDLSLTEIVASQAPFIVTPPQPSPAGTNFPGDTLVLSVVAGGYPDPAYQWQVNSTNIVGATNSSLVFSNLTFANVGSYTVVVTNIAGSVTSIPPVAIQLVVPLTNIVYLDTFSGTAGTPLNGRTPDTVGAPNQWIAGAAWLAGVDGATNDASTSGDGNGPNAFLPFVPSPGQVYVLSAVLDDQPGGGGWAALGFSSSGPTEGSLNQGSTVGWLLARDDGDSSPNQVFLGPGTTGGEDINDYSSGPATYSVILDTRPAQASAWTFSYQVNGVTLAPPRAFGGSGPSISYAGIGVYTGDAVTVDNFTVTALSAPIKPYFTESPQGGTYYIGQTATLTSLGGGALPLTYQWAVNSNNIAGATNLTLTLTNLVATNSGSYQLIVKNGLGSSASAPALLIVTSAPPVLNLSSNLVLHLKFDGDYLDYSGRGNNATNMGSTIVPGIVGSGAMSYGDNGTTPDLGYATLGTPSDLRFGASVSFSVSYWIQYPNVADNQTTPPNAFPNCDLPIIGNGIGATYQPGWVIAQGGEGCEGNPGAFFWSFNDSSAGAVVASGPAHSEDDGNWHHLVHIFDRDQGYGTTYLDGKLVDSTAISTEGSVDNGGTNTINIGQDPTAAYASAGAGNLDDLSIWRRALSGDEARALFAAGVSNHVAVASAPLPITTGFSGGQLTLTWSVGNLQSAASLAGPWTAVTLTTPQTYTTPATGSQQFYRVVQ